MINWFLRRKTAMVDSRRLQLAEIQRANKVLFALFTRYGDTIIDLVVMREFVERYPDKDYLVLCPRQMKPYVDELLPEVRCISLNKRNVVDMLKTDRLLKRWRPDIGFNPWSNGLDSCYFLTYCDRYHCYKDFIKPKIVNHYQVVRQYLSLPDKGWSLCPQRSKGNYCSITICPESTDSARSIPQHKLDKIISSVGDKYPDSRITIAALSPAFFRKGAKSFIFQKTTSSSRDFIHLIKESELVICADSAPMHIALALQRRVVGLFVVTKPELVVNDQSCLEIYDY